MARVLLIQGNTHERRVLSDQLEWLGFRITLAETAEAGAGELRRRRADLVLVDHAFGDELGRATTDVAMRPPVAWVGPAGARPDNLAHIGIDDYLGLPTDGGALRQLVDRLLPLGMSDRWTGRAFLAQVDGAISRYPPIRVVFLAHRVDADGSMSVETENTHLSIDLRGGRVVGCWGIAELLASVEMLGSPDDDLDTALARAVQSGVPPERALIAAGDGIGRALARLVEVDDGVVRFDISAPAPKQPMVLPSAIPRIIANGLRKVRSPAQVRESFAPHLEEQVTVHAPEDSAESHWGLPSVALRLMRAAREHVPLGQLLRPGSSEDASDLVHTVDLLVQLGILRLAAPDPSAVRLPARRSKAPPPPVPSDAETVIESPTGPVAPPEGRSEEETTADVDPRLGELLGARARLEKCQPWEVLGIMHSRDVSEGGINRHFREASGLYHPDRFIDASVEVQRLAQECFTLVSAAQEDLQDPRVVAELGQRLLAQETGRPYASPRERAVARLEHKRGQVVSKRREWATAADHYRKAADTDPTEWRYVFDALRAEWQAGRADGEQVVKQLRELTGPHGKEVAEVLFVGGEILLKMGREMQAHHLFAQAVEADPDHVGARRHMRLRDMRQRTTQKPETKGGGLKGLFGWGRKGGK